MLKDFFVIILQEVYYETEGYIYRERIKAFVQEWAAAVDEYAAVFSNEHFEQGVACIHF